MNRRDKALILLKEARDVIMDKIADEVLDDDNFVDQDGYSRSDEALFELGDRLWRMNQIINNMPVSEISRTNQNDTQFTKTTGDNDIDLRSFVIQQGVPLPTWNDFVREVEDENRNEASRILGMLARLDQPLAFQATNIFAAQYALYPDEFRGKAMSLRAQLAAGAAGSVNLIHELFGITGPKATEIYHSLRAVV